MYHCDKGACIMISVSQHKLALPYTTSNQGIKKPPLIKKPFPQTLKFFYSKNTKESQNPLMKYCYAFLHFLKFPNSKNTKESQTFMKYICIINDLKP